MPFLSKALAAIGALAALIMPSLPAGAAETANSEFVIVRPNDVVEDDLYAAAVKVSIEGEVRGDLTAVAAGEVVIQGSVTGSVFALAEKVTVQGSVGGSLRVVARELVIEGSVGRDVVAAVGEARMAPGSTVGLDTLIWALAIEARGSIGGDLTGNHGDLSLGGAVLGDVDVDVGDLEIVPPLSVGGDLGYRSDRPARGIEQADVGGVVVQKTPLPPNLRVRALLVFGKLLVVVFLTMSALTTAFGWPERTRAAVEAVGRRPLAAVGWGVAILLSPIALVGVGALLFALAPPEAALPVIGLLLPLVMASLGVVLVVGLVAGAPVAGKLGQRLFGRLDLYGALLAGSLILGVLWFLPFVGWLVPLVALPWGLGAWIVSMRGAGQAEAQSVSASVSSTS